MTVNLPARFTTGDTAPILLATCLDQKWEPVPIGGAEVRFLMRLRGSEEYKIDAPGFVDDGPKGVVGYSPIVGDMDEPGIYDCAFRLTYSDGRIEHYRNGPDRLVLIVEDF